MSHRRRRFVSRPKPAIVLTDEQLLGMLESRGFLDGAVIRHALALRVALRKYRQVTTAKVQRLAEGDAAIAVPIAFDANTMRYVDESAQS